MAETGFEIKNLDRWRRKLSDPNLFGRPLRRALSQSIEYAKGQTQERTRVDTGRARGSWETSVDRGRIPKWAKISSRLEYILPLEFGSAPHFPPISALQPWARRHGFGKGGAFLIARAISRRGTKGDHMLRDGMQATRPFFQARLNSAAKEIESVWKRR